MIFFLNQLIDCFVFSPLNNFLTALTSIYDVVDIGAAKTTIMEGRRAADGFTLQSVLTLVEYIGYEDNMNQVSWFPPETPEKKRIHH